MSQQLITSNEINPTTSISAGQITSVNANAITGLITSAQIANVAATKITGTVYVANTSITGSITPSQLSTGAPSWDAFSNLSVGGNLNVSGSMTVTGTTTIENVNISNTTIVTSEIVVAPTMNVQTINPGTANVLSIVGGTGGTANTSFFDTKGNLVVGMNPSTWSYGGLVELNSNLGGIIALNGAASGGMVQNAYYNNNWIYKNTGAATYYSQNSGIHMWFYAGSGTAGTTFTFTEGMRFNNAGSLLINTTNTTQNNSQSNIILNIAGNIQIGSAGNFIQTMGRNATNGGHMVYNNGTGYNGYFRENASNQYAIGYATTSTTSGLNDIIQYNANQALAGGCLSFGGGAAPSTAAASGATGMTYTITNSNSYGASARGFGIINTSGSAAYGAVYVSATSPSTDWQFGKGAYDANPYFEFASNGGSTLFARIDSSGNFYVPGSITGASKSFRISHPHPDKANTHFLTHVAVEAPLADVMYTGSVQLNNGSATVNIDQAAGMTEGTFVVLCRNARWFTSNETNWDAVRGSISGNILTITCQNVQSTANVSWMVIGERQDQSMVDLNSTDDTGRNIVEPSLNHFDYDPKKDPWHDDFTGPAEKKKHKAPLH